MKLTPLAKANILAGMAEGHSYLDAAREAGVTAGTARSWMRKGAQGKQPYADLADAVQKAQAQPRAEAMFSWRQSATLDWRAAKALVEYLDKREGVTPASVAAELEELLEVVRDELGENAREKVLRAIVARGRGEAAGGARTALRLVAGE